MTGPTLSNVELAKVAFFDKMRQLGENKGRGANAQVEAAVECTERSSEGIIDVKDADKIYDAFLGGEAKVSSVTGAISEEKSDRKQRVSELRQFIKMGGIKTIDPVSLVHQAVPWVREAMTAGRLGRNAKVYSALVSIARAQCKVPTHLLEKDEAIMAAMPKKGFDREEADEWGAVRDSANKIQNKHGRTDEGDKIVADIQLKIDELGGTSADRKRAAKARQELDRLQGKTTAVAQAPPAGKKVKRK